MTGPVSRTRAVTRVQPSQRLGARLKHRQPALLTLSLANRHGEPSLIAAPLIVCNAVQNELISWPYFVFHHSRSQILPDLGDHLEEVLSLSQ